MLEKRGLVARLLHRRPAVWYDFSWHDGIPKLEQREHGWYDYNYVMDRDGQVLFQIRDKRWTIRGVKMNRAQTKRQIEQQISEMKARERASQPQGLAQKTFLRGILCTKRMHTSGEGDIVIIAWIELKEK